MDPSAPDLWFFCFIKLPLADRSSQASTLSHWTRITLVSPPSDTMDYVGTEASTSHQPGSLQRQDQGLPHQTKDLPTLNAGSMRPPLDRKSLEYPYTQPQDLFLWPLPSCALYSTRPGPGQKLPTDHKPQAPWVLINVACS